MTRRLEGGFSNFKAEVNGPEYMDAIKRMEEEFGRDRTNAAITIAIDTHGPWLPTINVIRQCVPAPGGVKLRCQECAANEGWVFVGNRAKRCSHAGHITGPICNPTPEETRQHQATPGFKAAAKEASDAIRKLSGVVSGERKPAAKPYVPTTAELEQELAKARGKR